MSESVSIKEELTVIMSGHSLSGSDSSEEPPMEQWSSLIFTEEERNKKKWLASQGLYDPGSGEICAKYIPLSDSSIYRHPYYKYPRLKDPGIEEAILIPEKDKVYANDGQELYVDLCDEMDQHVVTIFHAGLLKEVINLNYYCVSSPGMRAMSIALEHNNIVKSFILTDNFIDQDACYHLGGMLKVNMTLFELDLSGCRIGPEGIRNILPGLEKNKTLCILNLKRNCLTDVGGIYLAEAVGRGLSVKRIYLNYNSLGSKTAAAFADSFEYYNTFTHIHLSWNHFFSLVGTLKMLNTIAESNKLEELDLSWNSLSGTKFAGAIKCIMAARNLTVLKLNNNNFQKADIDLLVAGMTTAKKLRVFSLANNPLTIEDANKVVRKMIFRTCKIQRLELDNIKVDARFIELLNKLKGMKSKKDVVITHGDLEKKIITPLKDMRLIIFNRLLYLTEIKPKKKQRLDVPLIILELARDKVEQIEPMTFLKLLKVNGAVVDDELIKNLAYAFPIYDAPKKGPVTVNINIPLLSDFVKRQCPDRKLPPAPPPSIPPLPPAQPAKPNKKPIQ